MSRASRRTAGRFVWLAALLLGGCSPRLPGPAECEAVALRTLRITQERQLARPQTRAAVALLTHQCITTPFDYEMVSCLEQWGRLDACLRDMALRHPERKSAGRGRMFDL